MYTAVASRGRNYHGMNWDVRSPLNNPRYDTMTKQGACRTVTRGGGRTGGRVPSPGDRQGRYHLLVLVPQNDLHPGDLSPGYLC